MNSPSASHATIPVGVVFSGGIQLLAQKPPPGTVVYVRVSDLIQSGEDPTRYERSPVTDGQSERSHVAQFQELTHRAKNFGLHVTCVSYYAFTLSVINRPDGTCVSFEKVSDCETLADLRAAISDYVADQRAKGAKF